MVSSSADKTFIKTGQLPQTDLLLDAEETPEEEAVPLWEDKVQKVMKGSNQVAEVAVYSSWEL